MFNRKQGISRTLLFILANALLTLVLVACGTSGGSGSTATPTPKPTPSPTPTSVPLTVYKGASFSISYPQGWNGSWNVGSSGTNAPVVFLDPSGNDSLEIVATPDPNGVIGAGASPTPNFVQNPQTETIASTTMVGGDTWSQKSVSGDATSNAGTRTVKFVNITDVHPANSSSSEAFSILYLANKTTFDSANAMYFQPMLQSFKFV
jgi:hypothetical protein